MITGLRVGYVVEMTDAAVFEHIFRQDYNFSQIFKSFD